MFQVTAVWPRCGIHKGYVKKRKRNKEQERGTWHENTQNTKQNVTPTQNHTGEGTQHEKQTVHRNNSEVHILTWRSDFASFFLSSSSSPPHFSVFPKLFLLHLLPLMLLGWQSTQNTSFHSTFLPSSPSTIHHSSLLFIHLNVHSCLPPRWNPLFSQCFVFFVIFLFQVRWCSNFTHFLFGFCCERLQHGGMDGVGGIKSHRKRDSYWERGENEGDNIRRRQEAQSDKESKMAFFEGAHGIRGHRKQRKAQFFSPHLSIFHTYSTWTSFRKHGQTGTKGHRRRDWERDTWVVNGWKG